MKKNLLLLLSTAFYFSINAQIITTVAGKDTAGYSGDGGQATAAKLKMPVDVTVDAVGNLYIADQSNFRVRKVNTLGIITTFAGNGIHGYSGDGGPATAAKIEGPSSLAFDAVGNLFISDGNYIRKINTQGIISTYASGYSVVGLTFDTMGNLFAVSGSEIVKIDTTGAWTLVAGGSSCPGSSTIAFCGDGGPATNAGLNHPNDIAFDAAGNLYIADVNNECIRMVNTNDIITTIAGDVSAGGSSGDGGPATAARLFYPYGVACDAVRNLYISDGYNHKIRMINTSGIISTVAGDGYTLYAGVGGYSGDGGPSIAAELNRPMGLTVDVFGNLYFADTKNNRIRKVTNVAIASINQVTNNNIQTTIYPNPTSTNFVIETNSTDKQTLQVFDVNGKLVLTQTINSKTNIDASHLAEGVYNLSLQNSNGVINKRLVIVR